MTTRLGMIAVLLLLPIAVPAQADFKDGLIPEFDPLF